MNSRRTNYDAQERVIGALWDFAGRQQDPALPHNATHPTEGGVTISVNLDAIGTALTTIMEAFGYDVQSIG